MYSITYKHRVKIEKNEQYMLGLVYWQFLLAKPCHSSDFVGAYIIYIFWKCHVMCFKRWSNTGKKSLSRTMLSYISVEAISGVTV